MTPLEAIMLSTSSISQFSLTQNDPPLQSTHPGFSKTLQPAESADLSVLNNPQNFAIPLVLSGSSTPENLDLL